jgi:hypothetical protein
VNAEVKEFAVVKQWRCFTTLRLYDNEKIVQEVTKLAGFAVQLIDYPFFVFDNRNKTIIRFKSDIFIALWSRNQ